MLQLQRVLSMIYPDQCMVCDALVTSTGGLCGTCWRATPFITGLVCDACGVPLPGQAETTAFCDDCMALRRPWEKGRAALSYRDVGRRLVLALKHADRTEIAPVAARWMAQAGAAVLPEGALLVPIPVHWSRLLSRRYNQAAELGRMLSQHTGLKHCPDALIRTRRTPRLDGMTVDQRFAAVSDAIQPNPRWSDLVHGRTVCLIDDVMTSGATLANATHALHASGADRVFVLVLARVEKAP